MRLLRHLMAADLRRFGWLVAAWIALVAAGTIVYAWLPIVADRGRLSEGLRMTAGVLWLARQVYRLVLIALVVHAHPAVGSTAFWMTRPIPPRLLVASKVLLIGLVTIGAPVMADIALAVTYAVPMGDTVVSAMQTALVNGLWVAVCISVAVVTRSFAQFTLVCGVAASSLVLLPLTAELLISPGRELATTRADVAFSPVFMVFAALLFAACLAVAWVVQYTRRSRPETIAVSAGGVCLALTIGMIPPPAFMNPKIDPPEWARGASLRLGPRVVRPDVIRESSGEMASAVVRATLTLPNLPAGWSARATLRAATVRTYSGSLDSYLPGSPQWGAALSPDGRSDDAPMRVALGHALGVDRVPGAFYGLDPAILFARPGTEADRLGSLHGQYHGLFDVALARFEAVGVLPLAKGATFQEGAYRVTIRDVRFDNVLTVRVQLSDVATGARGRGRSEYDFYLRNQSLRLALAGTRRTARAFSVLPGATTLADFATIAPGVQTSAEYLTYAGASMSGLDLTREWLKGAELVVVRVTGEGTIQAPLDIENFSVTPAPPGSGLR